MTVDSTAHNLFPPKAQSWQLAWPAPWAHVKLVQHTHTDTHTHAAKSAKCHQLRSVLFCKMIWFANMVRCQTLPRRRYAKLLARI